MCALNACALLCVLVFRQALRSKSEIQDYAKAPSVAQNVEELKKILQDIDKKMADQNKGIVAALQAVVAAENQRSLAAWEAAWSEHRMALDGLMTDKLATHHDHLIHDLDQNHVDFLERYKQVKSASKGAFTSAFRTHAIDVK